jgi:3,4-dihydroxy-2-butanone 4-phosphate synthase
MTDATFEEAFDWFAARAGQNVWIEVSRKDARNENADFVVLGLHTTLQEVRMVNDPEHATGVLRVPIGDDLRSGIDIDRACFQRAQIIPGVIKVWQHDIYVGASGGAL